jgi:small subunit ribosomal protein S9
MSTASTTVEAPADDAASIAAAADDPIEDVPAGGPAVATESPTESPEPETAEADAGAGADADAPEEYASEYSTETPAEDHPAEAAGTDSSAQRALTGDGGATGRRKEAIARVRLTPGTGQWRINGHKLDEYFPNKVHQQLVSEPFVTLGAEGRFDLVALISGGGVTGQAGALRLGIARALADVDPENRPALKKAGFLTRDARVKERKKYGLKKARKAPQYSKR